jgi:hypothetical protein
VPLRCFTRLALLPVLTSVLLLLLVVVVVVTGQEVEVVDVVVVDVAGSEAMVVSRCLEVDVSRTLNGPRGHR